MRKNLRPSNSGADTRIYGVSMTYYICQLLKALEEDIRRSKCRKRQSQRNRISRRYPTPARRSRTQEKGNSKGRDGRDNTL